jgi:cell division protein FtsX
MNALAQTWSRLLLAAVALLAAAPAALAQSTDQTDPPAGSAGTPWLWIALLAVAIVLVAWVMGRVFAKRSPLPGGRGGQGGIGQREAPGRRT